MIYSVIEHPCRCGRNGMATPTVQNVRAAPPPSRRVAAATVVVLALTLAATTGGRSRRPKPRMFMLLPPRLYLVVALALRCFSPVVVVVVVLLVVIVVVVSSSLLSSKPLLSAYAFELSLAPTNRRAFIITKHSCQLKVHQRPIYRHGGRLSFWRARPADQILTRD